MSDHWLDRLARASAAKEGASRDQRRRRSAASATGRGHGLDMFSRTLVGDMSRRRMLGVAAATVGALGLIGGVRVPRAWGECPCPQGEGCCPGDSQCCGTTDCCFSGAKCLGGKCCSERRLCGPGFNTCCPEGQSCCGGQCCPDGECIGPDPEFCGRNCPTTTTIDDQPWPTERVRCASGTSCCPAYKGIKHFPGRIQPPALRSHCCPSGTQCCGDALCCPDAMKCHRYGASCVTCREKCAGAHNEKCLDKYYATTLSGPYGPPPVLSRWMQIVDAAYQSGGDDGAALGAMTNYGLCMANQKEQERAERECLARERCQ